MKKYVCRLQINEMLGDRYLIIDILGSGGMGAVYLAEDLKLKGKRWAIKECIKPQVNTQQFIDEAEILIRLNHPHLPAISDYFPADSDGYSYLVIDYIEGQTLLEIFEHEQRKLTYKRIIAYCIQLCDLFSYLHSQKPNPIIYRDLKPSNIMIDTQDHVRLIDFGIARNFQVGHESDTIPLGTIGFAAPEQFEKQQTDHRTDLYNLGAVMYFLISGGHYYYVAQHKVSECRIDLPDGLEEIIVQLLQTNPEHRYQSAAEVKTVLESLHLSERSKVEYKELKHLGINNKVIVVGSLYAGAGSTFVSIALARALDHYQISNALIEHPAIEAELFYQLDGEAKKPANYSFWDQYILEQHSISDRTDWITGLTAWYPLNPLSSCRKDWSHEKCYKLLFSIQSSIIIIDVSDRWEDTSVQELCKDADEIIFVADAVHYKFNKALSQQRFDYAYGLQKMKKSVSFIANRDIPTSQRNEWIQSFPWHPECTIPNIAYADFAHAIWKGVLVQDRPLILLQLKEAMYPLLVRITSKEILKQRVQREKSRNKARKLSFWK